MKTQTYTPGHSPTVTDFMSKRAVQTHGQFFLSYLTPGLSVLDCGCGPGSITLSMAPLIAPGKIVGVDFASSQIERATSSAAGTGIHNAEFLIADCYSLPFDDCSFDRIFNHTFMEHLSHPVQAMKEFHRVLKPGGIVGVCSPDWGGFILAPPSEALSAAVKAYTDLQTRNGGDVQVGRKLSLYLAEAGFSNCQMSLHDMSATRPWSSSVSISRFNWNGKGIPGLRRCSGIGANRPVVCSHNAGSLASPTGIHDARPSVLPIPDLLSTSTKQL